MKKNNIFVVMILLFSSAFVYAGGNTENAEKTKLIVFNAASTTDLVNDLAIMFREKTGTEVKSNPASSGTLARQLKQGAKADIYISTSKKWMKYVRDLGLPVKDTAFAWNELVIIAPAGSARETISFDSSTSLPDQFGGRISIGDPAHVPAGKYAVEALKYYGWMEQLEDRIQPAADVRSALAVVEMEEAELGIVYKTDALKSGKVKIVGMFPEESHSPVVYYCAILKDSAEQAEAFYNFLSDKDAAAVFKKYGFSFKTAE